MRTTFRHAVVQVLRSVQAGWMILGVTLIMLLLVESCARVQRARSGVDTPRNPVASGEPQATFDWFPGYTREYDATRPQVWRSFVYWGRRPGFKGQYVNVDSAGRRVTPQPLAPATPAARVFFFGGSTMWGTSQRDGHTIPAEAARRLQAIAGPGQRIEVTNLAENGYVMTQEILVLMRQLQAGNRPDVVVFYDGINDVGTTVQNGVAALPQNEAKRVAEFAMGRVIDRSGFERGLRKDMRAWKALAGAGIKQFALYDWAQSKKAPPAESYIGADSAARLTARMYGENARMIEALGTAYGFVPIFVWQPSLSSTTKQLTPYEQRTMQSIERSPYWRRQKETHQVIAPYLDSAMATVAPERFVNAIGLFKGDTMAVFTDRIGHNTEASIPRIVDSFWPVLEAAIQRQRAAAQRARPGTVAVTPVPQRTN